MDRKALTEDQIAKAFAHAVRSVHALTPGVYRYVYPHLTKYNYGDIAVLGLSSTEGKYRYVPLRESRFPYGEQEGYLSDAGVAKDGPYNNFLVPIEVFDHLDGVNVVRPVTDEQLAAGMKHIRARRAAHERISKWVDDLTYSHNSYSNHRYYY